MRQTGAAQLGPLWRMQQARGCGVIMRRGPGERREGVF